MFVLTGLGFTPRATYTTHHEKVPVIAQRPTSQCARAIKAARTLESGYFSFCVRVCAASWELFFIRWIPTVGVSIGKKRLPADSAREG